MGLDVNTPEQPVSPHRTLLGRLAWRSKLDEPFATDALAVLLEEPEIRSSFLRDLQKRYHELKVDLDLLSISRIDPRVSDKDFGTPDLVGFDDSGRPILVVEAKFDHYLEHVQVTNYLELQQREVRGSLSALVLLVPKYKIDAAWETGRVAARQLGLDESMVLAVSWQDVLDVMERAAHALGQGHRSYSADIAQLQDFVEERTHSRLAVLAEALSIANWDENVMALESLGKLASRQVAGKRAASLEGTAHLDVYGYGPARYVLERDGVFWTLGPHKAFASQGAGPLWLRFSAGTGTSPQEVAAIRSRLVSKGNWTLRDDHGHVWIRIEVEESWDEESTDQVLDRVVQEVLGVLDVALPPVSRQP